jgi:hypothetical protein
MPTPDLFTIYPQAMSKDQVNWQVHCIIQELYFLNDRLIQGDHTERSALKVAKGWATDLADRLRQIDSVTEAWTDVHIAYGGFVCLSWNVTLYNGETIKGALTPVRKK